MSRFLVAPLLAGVLLLVAGGCLESQESVTLRADGSGTIEGRYVVDLKKLRELIDMARMLYPQEAEGTEIPDELPNPFDRRWFEHAAHGQKGLSITGGETTEKDGVRTSTIRAAFTSIEAAARGGAFFSSNVSLAPFVPKAATGKDAGDGGKPGGREKPVTPGGGDGGDGDPGGARPAAPERPKAWKLTLREIWMQSMAGLDPAQVLPAFEAQLSSARIERRFTLPAKVISTNGRLAEDGRTVTFTVGYKTVVEGKALSMEVVFENPEGLALKAFTYAPDVMTLVPRFRGQPPKAKADAAAPEAGK